MTALPSVDMPGTNLKRLDHTIVTVTTWMALAFFLILIAAGTVTGEAALLRRSVTPVVVAMAGAIMLLVGRPRAMAQLVVGAFMMAFYVGIVDKVSRPSALIGLVSMGIVGTLLVRRFMGAYLIAAAGGLGVVAYWWNIEAMGTTERVVAASGPAMLFGFTSLILICLNRELRKSESRLRGLVRSRDLFIAAVSHELRTPMTAVVGLSAELRDRIDSFSAQEIAECTVLLAEQSTEVASIVDDLLIAARSDFGLIQVEPTRVMLDREAASVAETTMPALIIEAGETPTVVWADPGRVRQILRNLITNGDRYGGAAVRVRIYQSADSGVIEIRDDGPPIAEEARHRMFEAYHRAHDLEGVSGAIGIGLTVSRQLAEQMNGTLTYHHDGETIFRLTLPLENPTATPDTRARTLRRALSPLGR